MTGMGGDSFWLRRSRAVVPTTIDGAAEPALE